MGQPMRKLKLWKSTNKVVSHYTIKEAVLTCIPEAADWTELRFMGAWFMCYYNSLSSYEKIAKALKIANSGAKVKTIRGVQKIDRLLRIGDRDTLKNFRTIQMLIEGTDTPGEQIYINYLKSGKSIFDYLTKEYKHDI